MKRVVVTGASGFIGRKLVERLLAEECEVLAILRNPDKIKDICSEKLHIIHAELNHISSAVSNVGERGFDAFYHLAWDGTFGDSFKDYHRQLSNAAYAGDALLAAKQLECNRFVLVGSIVQTEVEGYILRDEYELRFSCIYGAAKNAAEIICKTLAFQNGIEMNTAILASVYGDGDCSEMVQNVLIMNLLEGKSPKLVSSENLYDWIYVDDVVSALIAIGRQGVPNRTYYVGHRELETFEKLVTLTRDVIAPDVELRFGELPDKTSIDYSLIDREALYRDTGFYCKADLTESILKTAEWLKGQYKGKERQMQNCDYVNLGGGNSLYNSIFFSIPIQYSFGYYSCIAFMPRNSIFKAKSVWSAVRR